MPESVTILDLACCGDALFLLGRGKGEIEIESEEGERLSLAVLLRAGEDGGFISDAVSKLMLSLLALLAIVLRITMIVELSESSNRGPCVSSSFENIWASLLIFVRWCFVSLARLLIIKLYCISSLRTASTAEV